MSTDDILRRIAETLVGEAPEDFGIAVLGDLLVAAEVCTTEGGAGVIILTDIAAQDQPRFLSQLLSVATGYETTEGSGT